MTERRRGGPSHIVRNVHLTTADEFLDALSFRGEHLRALQEPNAWVFRGHGNSNWSLLPSALREDGLLATMANMETSTNRAQIKAELAILRAFFNTGDANGLHLPEDTQETRKQLHRIGTDDFLDEISSGDAIWPPYFTYSLFALVQHYDLPTRLLDWTYDPRVAAYFAAVSAAQAYSTDEPTDANDQLAVWAFCRPNYFELRRVEEMLGTHLDVILVSAPLAQIPNLNAQNGLFLLARPLEIALDAPVDRRPLDVALEESTANELGLDIFLKFTLPVSQSGRLLFLLAIEGVTGAKLFPGYYGVTKAIRERGLWLKPPSRILLLDQQGE